MNLYLVKIDPDQLYETLRGYEVFLTRDRTERIARLRFEADRLRSLAAGLLINLGLSRYVRGEDPADHGTVPVQMLTMTELLRMQEPVSPAVTARLRTGAHGKPYLDCADDFFFSVSHAGEYVAYASDCRTVGVDIERVQLRENVARRFYAPEEQEAVRSGGAPVFTEIWTEKEAFLKWSGRGRADPLSGIAVRNAGFLAAHGVCFSGLSVGGGTYRLTVCSDRGISLREE